MFEYAYLSYEKDNTGGKWILQTKNLERELNEIADKTQLQALNCVGQQGWELVQTSIEQVMYILKRQIRS